MPSTNVAASTDAPIRPHAHDRDDARVARSEKGGMLVAFPGSAPGLELSSIHLDIFISCDCTLPDVHPDEDR
jgi:hypothetical protein